MSAAPARSLQGGEIASSVCSPALTFSYAWIFGPLRVGSADTHVCQLWLAKAELLSKCLNLSLYRGPYPLNLGGGVSPKPSCFTMTFPERVKNAHFNLGVNLHTLNLGGYLEAYRIVPPPLQAGDAPEGRHCRDRGSGCISCYRTPGPWKGFRRGFWRGLRRGLWRVLEGF